MAPASMLAAFQSKQIDGYAIDILVQGYPGKTVCHGGLGWSTIALLRSGRLDLTPLVTSAFPLLDAPTAIAFAQKPGVMKVLLHA